MYFNTVAYITEKLSLYKAKSREQLYRLDSLNQLTKSKLTSA